jgi:hypothetical protein
MVSANKTASRKFLKRAAYIVGCVVGLCVMVFGFLVWKQQGFRIVTSGSQCLMNGEGFWIGFIGFVLFAYCLFGFVSFTRYLQSGDTQGDS